MMLESNIELDREYDTGHYQVIKHLQHGFADIERSESP